MAKKRTRANGDGSIFFDEAKGLYTAKMKIGFNEETGKTIYKRFSSKKRNLAKKKMDDYLLSNPQLNLNKEKLILDTYINKFLYEVKKPKVTSKTLQRYLSIYNTHMKESEKSKNVCPFLYKQMPDIETSEVRAWYGELINNNVGDFTQKLIHILINGGLRLALEDRIINYNPLGSIIMRKESVDDDDVTPVLSSAEQKILIGRLDMGKSIDRLFYFVLGTGLRLGECLCLRWNNIQEEDKQMQVEIKLSLSRVKQEDGSYKEIEKPPKTKASKRKVPISDKLFLEMQHWNHTSANDLIFPHPKDMDGSKYIFHRMPLRHIKKICTDLKITPVTVRGLRHTYATRHFEAGTPIKTVQKFMGHSKIETTQNIYIHVMPDIKTRDAQNIDKFL